MGVLSEEQISVIARIKDKLDEIYKLLNDLYEED